MHGNKLALGTFYKTNDLASAWRSFGQAALARLPDRLAISLLFAKHLRRWPDLDHPRTFSEKLNARKLGRRDPRLPALADKVAVKEFVRARLGEGWVVPTLWTGTTLPPAPVGEGPIFVKPNHGSGWGAVYRPGDTHWPAIAADAEEWLKSTYGLHLREWHYAQIVPCLLIEPFMNRADEYPLDYRILVFNGRAEQVMVTRRKEGRKHAFTGAYYDRNWERQSYRTKQPFDERGVERPASLEAMLAAAETLAEGFDFVRVDFYEVEGRPKFGELTFFPDAGFTFDNQPDSDRRMGELWRDFRP